jgi:oligosaccharide repeat unit polymerase
MILIITGLAGVFSLTLGRLIFKSLYNPISIYYGIWSIEIFLYQWRLVAYYEISLNTWVVIIGAYFCFIAGIVTLYLCRNLIKTTSIAYQNDHHISTNSQRYLNYFILSTAFIGILGAIQHWTILFKEFHSLVNILNNAPKIYRMRVEGDIHGVIPYITSFLFVSIFFSGVYTGKTGKFSFGVFIAFLGVVLDDLANVGRAAMLFAFFEFSSVVILSRINLDKNLKNNKINGKIIISIVIILIILIGFATFVKSLRTGLEEFKGSSRELNKFKSGILISPSIYLYFSCQIGVLNRYLEKDDETVIFGENTFLPIYNLISKTGVLKRPVAYQKGYYTPIWSNTGTYLRDIHADFGYLGIFIFPYIFAVIIAFIWFKYFRTRSNLYLILLVYCMLIVKFSFLTIVTRLGIWWISLFILLIANRIIEKMISKKEITPE